MRFLSAAALVVALAIALGSCGGDDGGSSASRSGATGPTGAAQPPPSDSGSGSDSGADNGTGGASAPAGDKGNDSQAPTSGSKGSGKKQDNGGGEQRASQDRTPTSLEELSPAQRRELERSLYSQAKELCSAYTVAQLKESYNIHANEMEDVARKFAELYEQAAPSLVLPYQQGCLAGLRERERKNRRAATDQVP